MKNFVHFYHTAFNRGEPIEFKIFEVEGEFENLNDLLEKAWTADNAPYIVEGVSVLEHSAHPYSTSAGDLAFAIFKGNIHFAKVANVGFEEISHEEFETWKSSITLAKAV